MAKMGRLAPVENSCSGCNSSFIHYLQGMG
jgi:hypothetical protein